jgi:hypothetical protein
VDGGLTYPLRQEPGLPVARVQVHVVPFAFAVPTPRAAATLAAAAEASETQAAEVESEAEKAAPCAAAQGASDDGRGRAQVGAAPLEPPRRQHSRRRHVGHVGAHLGVLVDRRWASG